MPMGTGPSGPRVRAEGGQQQVAREEAAEQGRHGHGCHGGAPGVPEGRGRPSLALDLEGAGVRRRGKPEARWRPVVAGPPARQPSWAQQSAHLPAHWGTREKRAHPGGALPRSVGTLGPAPGQPVLGKQGPACCPALRLPGPGAGPFLTGAPHQPAPSSRPRGCGQSPRKSRGAGDSPARREQCCTVALWRQRPPTHHRPHVAKSLVRPRFRPAGPWGLRPGTGTSSLDTETIEGGIKAACVGTERQASPWPTVSSPSQLSGGVGGDGAAMGLVWGQGQAHAGKNGPQAGFRRNP